jgi:IS605 OrfB family transposase
MILTHKNRLKGKRAVRQQRRYAWAVNQVWNFCAQTQRAVQRAWKDGLSPKWPSYYDLTDLTAGTSKDLGLHAKTIQEVCKQFVKSRDTHKKCPAFRKSGGSKRSLGWIPFTIQSRQITSSSVTYLGNEYRFFGAKRRPLPDTAKGGCFVEDARGRWWVCFHVEVEDLPQAAARAVGIDLGLKTLATLSTGQKIEAPRHYRKLEKKLATAQRAGRHDLAKAINERIRNKRRDHRHKSTTWITQNFRLIFIGDVSSSKLAKTKMAKSVYDAGWYASKQALRYKASRHGGICEEVSELFTTQICSECGAKPPSRPRGIADLGIREWACSECGACHDRDVNAARNHLTLGLSALSKSQLRILAGTHQPPVEESRLVPDVR